MTSSGWCTQRGKVTFSQTRKILFAVQIKSKCWEMTDCVVSSSKAVFWTVSSCSTFISFPTPKIRKGNLLSGRGLLLSEQICSIFLIWSLLLSEFEFLNIYSVKMFPLKNDNPSYKRQSRNYRTEDKDFCNTNYDSIYAAKSWRNYWLLEKYSRMLPQCATKQGKNQF